MNLVTIIWSMVAASCLTLATLQLMVWFRDRKARASLFFALTAVSVAGMAFFELRMMQAQTPEQFCIALRWLHVPIFAIIVALVCFIRVYLHAGRPWLAWTVCLLRAFSLLPDFLVGQNLNYLEVVRLRSIQLFGEVVSIAEGRPNPWMLVGQLSLVLFVVFVMDVVITLVRRRDRRQAVGGMNMIPGLAPDELMGSYYDIAGLSYRYRLGRLSPSMGKDVYAIGGVSAGNAWQTSSEIDVEDVIVGTMIGVAMDTIVGPIAVGYGQAEQGARQVYFSVGKIF